MAPGTLVRILGPSLPGTVKDLVYRIVGTRPDGRLEAQRRVNSTGRFQKKISVFDPSMVEEIR